MNVRSGPKLVAISIDAAQSVLIPRAYHNAQQYEG